MVKESQSFSIAVVSGKGGSGKTLLATTLAMVFVDSGIPVTLVDTDGGTGGMTYFLGLKQVSGIGTGLSELLNVKTREEFDYTLSKSLKLSKFDSKLSFIGIGDHRKRISGGVSEDFSLILKAINDKISKSVSGVTIYDCRGGVDEESLGVCHAADHIMITAETDAASFQTTQFLVHSLADRGLSHKIKGFFINKVFDNPSVIARTGSVAFKAEFLSAIPFDIDTIRNFLVGELPTRQSPFYINVWSGLFRAYPDLIMPPKGRVWEFSDFNNIGINDPDSSLGGMIVLLVIVASSSVIISRAGTEIITDPLGIAFIALIFAGAMGSIPEARRMIGRAFAIYFRIYMRIFRRILDL